MACSARTRWPGSLLREASERVGRPLGDSAVRASIGLGTTDEHVERLIAGGAGVGGSGLKAGNPLRTQPPSTGTPMRKLPRRRTGEISR